MSNENLPAPSGDHHPVVKGLLAAWEEIKDIPSTVKAIAKFIGAGVDAVTAHVDRAKAIGEQKATATRDETKARSAVSEALTQAAVQRALTDPGLADRALELWADERITKQANREAVAVIAIEDLRANPPPDQEPPSDDWMNVFSSYAERASSDTLRQHWGHILAGEIRKPGSFSFQTLQLMSILDKNLAEIIERTCPAITDGSFIPDGPPFDKGPRFNDLMELDAVGFLRLTQLGRQLQFSEQGVIGLRFKRRLLLIHGQPDATAELTGCSLTKAGRELVSIVQYQDDLDLIREVAVQFQGELGFFENQVKIEKIELKPIVGPDGVQGGSETLWTRPKATSPTP